MINLIKFLQGRYFIDKVIAILLLQVKHKSQLTYFSALETPNNVSPNSQTTFSSTSSGFNFGSKMDPAMSLKPLQPNMIYNI
jgi:hypothetical protein